MALKYCKGGYPNKEDCSWYHGNWMLFRYLGLVSNPYWHQNFFEDAIDLVNAKKSNTFLIIGTADFSMPLLCSQVGVKYVEICDICKTPLKICEMISEYLGLNWNIFEHNIWDDLQKKYSVIINDAFISRFEDKQSLLLKIAEGLVNGGYYITTLKKGNVNRGGEVSEELKYKFINKALCRYETSTLSKKSIPIKRMATEYVEKMSSFPVNSKEEVIDLFTKSGFEIIRFEIELVEGEYEPTEYFCIVAKKIVK